MPARVTAPEPPRGKKSNCPDRPADERTIWKVDTDLERNTALREKLLELALALAERIADADHDAAVARRSAAAAAAPPQAEGRGRRRKPKDS